MALAMPGEIAERLSLLQHGLPGARWRAVQSLHITLRFVGEVAETLADDLDSELAAVSAERFPMQLSGVGSFNDGVGVRAVWAGVAENSALRRLASRCNAAARRSGLASERRRFFPHVTLAYLNGVDPDRVARWIQTHNLWTSAKFRVEQFGLFSSRLGGGGSTYRLERAYDLA